MSNKEYQPVDLGNHPDFSAKILLDKRLIVLPSQGQGAVSKILYGFEGEMLYEHRQEAEAMTNYPGIFVSRLPLPKAEKEYRQKLFGSRRPKWFVPTNWREGVPLDQIVLADERFLSTIARELDGQERTPFFLYGFSSTPYMERIADRLGVKYYGNAEFSNWAGTKIGLEEFTKECGVPTPPTFSLHSADQLLGCALKLKEKGYEELVVKVNNSTGGMGHLISNVKGVIKDCREGYSERGLPPEFLPEEGAIVQAWIPQAVSISLGIFVDFDGSYCFTGAQAHLLEGESALGAVGAEPIDQKYLNPLLSVGNKIARGYVRHQAWGPHTMGMLMTTPEVCEKYGFSIGVPICNDENTRPGASTISKAWILAIREEKYGVGWLVSKIKVPQGTKIAQVINKLSDEDLLIKKTGPRAEGVFVFNGSVLDCGYERKFYALAISAEDDPFEAAALIEKTRELFK